MNERRQVFCPTRPRLDARLRTPRPTVSSTLPTCRQAPGSVLSDSAPPAPEPNSSNPNTWHSRLPHLRPRPDWPPRRFQEPSNSPDRHAAPTMMYLLRRPAAGSEPYEPTAPAEQSDSTRRITTTYRASGLTLHWPPASPRIPPRVHPSTDLRPPAAPDPHGPSRRASPPGLATWNGCVHRSQFRGQKLAQNHQFCVMTSLPARW